MSQRKRLVASVIAIPLLLVGFLALMFYRMVQQYRRNDALVLAIQKNDTRAVLKLLDEGADPNTRDMTDQPKLTFFQRFKKAVVSDDEGYEPQAYPVLYMMLVETDLDRKTGRHIPHYPENTTIVKALLDHGADSNTTLALFKTTVLMMAAKDGYDDTVRLLLDHGAKPDTPSVSGSTPLMFAAGKCAETLIAHGADVHHKDNSKNTPLICASGRGEVEVVRTLFRHGADVQMDRGGEALRSAANMGEAPILQILLDKGVQVNARDEVQWTALHYAAWDGHMEAIKVLLDHGADVNAKNDLGRTVLHMVNRQFPPPFTRLLLSHGAKINAQDQDGYTPLMWAVQCENSSSAQALLAAGADYKLKGKKGQTALQQAIQGKKAAIIAMLKQAGAKE